MSLILILMVVFSGSLVFAADNFEQTVVDLETNNGTGIISIVTNVENVEVYINHVYKGLSPITVETLTPGFYYITLLKDGYEEKETYVQVTAGTQNKLFFELEPLLGFLQIKSNVRDAQIYINDEEFDNKYQYVDSDLIESVNSLDTGLFQIPVGIHTITYEKFGYATETQTVAVFDKMISSLDVELEKSLLEISGLDASPNSFNPNLSQALGETTFYVDVTAPCTISYEIFDVNNVLVFTSVPVITDKKSVSFTWDGANYRNNILRAGIYTVVLTAKPQSGWVSRTSSTESANFVTSTTVVIDDSLFYPLVSLKAGGTSTGIPTPRFMPKGTSLLSISGAADFALKQGFNTNPFSLDYAYTPHSNLELAFRIGFEPQDDLPVFFGGSLKYAVPVYPYFVGGLLKYTYSTEETRMPTFSEPGLGLGIIGGVEVGSFLFSASEEVVIGSKKGNIVEVDGHLKTGLSAQYQADSFSSNTWFALYSPFVSGAMSVMGGIETGFDISYLLPDSSISPTIGVQYYYTNNKTHNLAIRFGLNMLFL